MQLFDNFIPISYHLHLQAASTNITGGGLVLFVKHFSASFLPIYLFVYLFVEYWHIFRSN
jgi:hypothetical protein